MSAVRHVTIDRFEQLAGYTAQAVRSKIKRGDWLEGAVWRRAPDGRVLIDLEGYEWWVLNGHQVSAQLLTRQSKSTSTTAAPAAGSD